MLHKVNPTYLITYYCFYTAYLGKHIIGSINYSIIFYRAKLSFTAFLLIPVKLSPWYMYLHIYHIHYHVVVSKLWILWSSQLSVVTLHPLYSLPYHCVLLQWNLYMVKCTDLKNDVHSCNHHPNQVTNINITPQSSIQVRCPLPQANTGFLSP